MSEIIIRKVETEGDKKRFLTFPWKVYRDDPLWVPPLLPERRNVLDPEKGAFLRRGEADLFLAYKDGNLAGTICSKQQKSGARPEDWILYMVLGIWIMRTVTGFWWKAGMCLRY